MIGLITFDVILTVILGIDDIILVLQQNRLRWYVHVLCKEDTDWVKKCMEYEVVAPDQEVDQKGRVERGCAKRLPSTQFEQGECE